MISILQSSKKEDKKKEGEREVASPAAVSSFP